MSKPRSASSKGSAPDAAMKRLGDTATVVAFTPPKRRGRPRKPPPVDRRCKDDFDTVAMAVAGIASKPTLWNAAKERVSRWADRDRGLRPASAKVLRFLVEKVNRQKGYDWHPADAIGREVAICLRAVEKAFHELIMGGYLLRESEAVSGRRKATRRWRTTIPALTGAAKEVSVEREAKARARLGLPAEAPGPAQKMRADPNKNSLGPEQKSRDGPAQKFGCSLREPLEREPLDESSGCAGDDLNDQPEPAIEPGVGKLALQEEPGAAAAPPPGDTVRETVPSKAGSIPVPSLRPSPRYDRNLPMEHRLSIPGGRYAVGQTRDDQALRRRMDRAARGWDLHDLRARFVAWADSARTPDAIEGFIRWMHSYRPTAAPNWLDLNAGVGQPTDAPPGAIVTDTGTILVS